MSVVAKQRFEVSIRDARNTGINVDALERTLQWIVDELTKGQPQWADPTGTEDRTTFDTTTVTTESLAEHFMALITDLKVQGVLED